MIVSVTDSAFSDGKILSLVDRSLNPVSMLHYNTDLSQKDNGTLPTEVPIHKPMMDKAVLDFMTIKVMSSHGARKGADGYLKRLDSQKSW